MSCLSALSKFAILGLLVASSLVSIGISAWQFQSAEKNYTFYDDNGTAVTNFVSQICNAYPVEYMRPWKIICTPSNCSGDYAYCGYSESSTGYRIAIAVCTIFVGALLGMNFMGKSGETPYVLATLLIAWIGVTASDSALLANASASCSAQMKLASNQNNACSMSQYGITIAVDVGATILAGFAYILVDGADNAGVKLGGGSNTV